ncbi:MAG: hypothetical protein ACC657_17865 [Thiohalomonadales bacterium]
MAKAKNPSTFSHTFNIDKNVLSQLGVLDVTLAIDTKLFIDPLLLQSSNHTELNTTAYSQFQNHFEQVIKLLSASRAHGDPAWKAAQRMLAFPEIPGTCLGYGAGSIHGSGFGPTLTSRIVTLAKQIVDIGIEDPDLFVAMALFEPDIGPDRISDMITNIIFGALVEFNRKILNELKLTGEKFTFNRISGKFIPNPFEEKNTPIVLLPNDILKDLPIANDWDGVVTAASENDQLRHELNIHVGEIWARKTKRDKSKLKNDVLQSKEAFSVFLAAIKNVSAEPYDTVADPEGLVRWATKGQEYADKYPLALIKTKASSLDDVYTLVHEIITQFRQLIEHEGLNKELYRSNKKPRHESTAQRLFFAVAYSYCVANNVDISPEIDTGNGKIDFKFSIGFNQRVLVEVKLSTNSKVVSGYTTQLEVYKASQKTMKAIYLVIDVGSMGKKDERIIKKKNEAAKNGDPLSDIEFIDGLVKPSASLR